MTRNATGKRRTSSVLLSNREANEVVLDCENLTVLCISRDKFLGIVGDAETFLARPNHGKRVFDPRLVSVNLGVLHKAMQNDDYLYSLTRRGGLFIVYELYKLLIDPRNKEGNDDPLFSFHVVTIQGLLASAAYNMVDSPGVIKLALENQMVASSLICLVAEAILQPDFIDMVVVCVTTLTALCFVQTAHARDIVMKAISRIHRLSPIGQVDFFPFVQLLLPGNPFAVMNEVLKFMNAIVQILPKRTQRLNIRAKIGQALTHAFQKHPKFDTFDKEQARKDFTQANARQSSYLRDAILEDQERLNDPTELEYCLSQTSCNPLLLCLRLDICDVLDHCDAIGEGEEQIEVQELDALLESLDLYEKTLLLEKLERKMEIAAESDANKIMKTVLGEMQREVLQLGYPCDNVCKNLISHILTVMDKVNEEGDVRRSSAAGTLNYHVSDDSSFIESVQKLTREQEHLSVFRQLMPAMNDDEMQWQVESRKSNAFLVAESRQQEAEQSYSMISGDMDR